MLVWTAILAAPAHGTIYFRDCYGSTAGTFQGSWRLLVSSISTSLLGVGIPDPTWGGTKTMDDALCNTQNVASFSVEPSLPSDSTWIDLEHGYHWVYFRNPPSSIYVDVRVTGTAGATTRGLAMCDHRDPTNAWCQKTDNIDPGEWHDLALQIEAQLDSGSLCGNEGLIQACAAYAGYHYGGCRDAAICMAGLLRSVGIPASADVTYQIATSASFGGLGVTIVGGMHAQVSAWNWTSGEWERCDPAYAAGFVHPADIKIGGVRDPDYLAPRIGTAFGDPDPVVRVQYSSGAYGDAASFVSIQYREDEVLGINKTVASLCFSTYGCGKHDTMPVSPPDALSGIDGDCTSGIRELVRPLMNPCRGEAAFRSSRSVRIDLFSPSGRWVRTLSGTGEIRGELGPGLYLYRATGDSRVSGGKLIVVR